MISSNCQAKRVFVLGAYIPGGGTYMAYHLGVILHRYWAYEPVAIVLDPALESHSVWEYDVPFSTMGMAEMLECATVDDLLIANPSFSEYLLGFTFPGKSLMYVQGFNTFYVIDGFFDKYVAVSPFVQRFLFHTYGMEVPVIPPFLHYDHMTHPISPWEERPEGSVATMLKWQGGKLFKHFEAKLRERHPDLPYSVTLIPPNTPHRQVLHEMSQHRYFLWLSPLEGFGLLPLEAMMCQCAVVGFHTCGGLTYFEHNINAVVSSYPDMAQLVESFNTLLSDHSLAKDLIRAGSLTASGYSLKTFQQCWIGELTSFLGPPITSL